MKWSTKPIRAGDTGTMVYGYERLNLQGWMQFAVGSLFALTMWTLNLHERPKIDSSLVSPPAICVGLARHACLSLLLLSFGLSNASCQCLCFVLEHQCNEDSIMA